MTVVDELRNGARTPTAAAPGGAAPQGDEGDENDGGADGDGGGGDGGGGDGGEGPWVTVATFWQPPPAHVARLMLEAEGIDSVILDENLVATDWLFANAVGGIKLQVPASAAWRALELLEGNSAATVAPQAGGEPLFDGQARCPHCGSADVYPVRLARRLVFLSILLLGAPLPIFARRSRCAACGSEWR